MPAKHLLILGGTGDARRLAEAASQRFGDALAITNSLAGATQARAALAGAVRSGGFGGAAGLAAYLGAAQVDLVIDATHPFAARISASARQACASTGLPLLQLARPAWEPEPGDRWIEVASLAEAAALIPRLGRRVFLTTGRTGLDAFAALADIHFIVRLIASPAAPLPLASYELILARGPFTLAEERRIIARYGIDLLVTKASGGAATAAKLAAARAATIPVLMVRRPAPPGGMTVERIEDAITWLENRLGNCIMVPS